MLTPRSLPFLQGGRILRRVRSGINLQIQEEPAIRLQPGLLDLRIAPEPIPDASAILNCKGGIALCGPPGSGRSLALLQIQARWAASGAGGPVIALALASDDATNLSPRAVVAGALHQVGLPAAYAEGGRPMLLLLDDWEDLAADRRALWRSYVFTATGWAAARVVISLPDSERWPGMTILDLTPPDERALDGWLSRLLPGHDPQPIIAALEHEPLAALRASTGDLLLLTLIYPITGIPSSRAQLYEQAYALARPVLDEVGGRLAVGRAALRHYRLARGLAGGADLAALTTLPVHEIAAVAPLAAGLLSDPSPILNLLWANGEPGLSSLHGLAACLRERPTDAPEQHLRLIALLTSATHHALRTLVAPALADVFASASHKNLRQATGVLRGLAERWDDADVVSLLLQIIDRPDAAEPLRWAATDLLAARPDALASLADLPADADLIARAARAHVIALAAPTQRAHLLGPDLRPGLDALIAGAGGDERRESTIATLAADQACPDELRTLAMAHIPAHPQGALLLQRALADHSPALRHAALTALAAWPADQTLRMLSAALAEAGHDDAALRDLLAAVGQIPRHEATGLIVRYALGEQGGIELRITALRLLALRPDGLQLLPRFLAAESMPAPLRAAAARLIGGAGMAVVIPLLRQIMLGDGAPLLRRAAAAALADLARTDGGRAAAVAAMIDAIAHPDLDATLTARIAAGLGAAGATTATPALSTLLHPDRPAALRAGWLAALPNIPNPPATLWQAAWLHPSVRAMLLDAIAIGNTVDDQPSSLEELGLRQAEQTAVAAASALADIAVQRPNLAAELCSRIRRAILSTTEVRPHADMFAALARAAGDHIASELEAILDSPASTPALRWAALDQLGGALPCAEWALERLRAGSDELFIQGKLATIIGELGDQRAVPDLQMIATSPNAELRLRTCAATALGMIGGVEAHHTLLSIARADHTPLSLRVASVNALPHPLSDETRRTLRQIAHAQRGGANLSVAIGKALAHAGDREVLPLLLRIAQGEQADEVIDAIDAIGDLGDPSAAPVLVRMSQSASAGPSVRLAASAALLRLDGPTHLPLLRVYLNSPILPIRARAYQILAQIDPLDPHLVEPLADTDGPLPLRLAALERLPAHQALRLIGAILQHTDEPAQLRLGIAEALGRSGAPEAALMLMEALHTDGPPLLRRRCVEALGELAAAGVETAQAALLSLSQASDTLSEIHQWATDRMLEHALQRSLV